MELQKKWEDDSLLDMAWAMFGFHVKDLGVVLIITIRIHPVIKSGTGKSTINGGFNGKLMYSWLIPYYSGYTINIHYKWRLHYRGIIKNRLVEGTIFVRFEPPIVFFPRPTDQVEANTGPSQPGSGICYSGNLVNPGNWPINKGTSFMAQKSR